MTLLTGRGCYHSGPAEGGRFLYSIKLYRTSVHGVEVIHRNAQMHNKIDPTHLHTKMSLSIIISRGELRGNFVQVNISCSVAMNHESS